MHISLDYIIVTVSIQLLLFHSLEQLSNYTHVFYSISQCHHAFVCYQSKHVVMNWYPQQANFLPMWLQHPLFSVKNANSASRLLLELLLVDKLNNNVP